MSELLEYGRKSSSKGGSECYHSGKHSDDGRLTINLQTHYLRDSTKFDDLFDINTNARPRDFG